MVLSKIMWSQYCTTRCAAWISSTPQASYTETSNLRTSSSTRNAAQSFVTLASPRCTPTHNTPIWNNMFKTWLNLKRMSKTKILRHVVRKTEIKRSRKRLSRATSSFQRSRRRSSTRQLCGIIQRRIRCCRCWWTKRLWPYRMEKKMSNSILYMTGLRHRRKSIKFLQNVLLIRICWTRSITVKGRLKAWWVTRAPRKCVGGLYASASERIVRTASREKETYQTTSHQGSTGRQKLFYWRTLTTPPWTSGAWAAFYQRCSFV